LAKQKHKVPLKVRFYRAKNTGILTFVDKLIDKIHPSKKCEELPGEILFNRNDKIGDALVTVPVLRDLKLNHPSVIIDVLCSEINSFIFTGLPFINKIHIYNKDNHPELEFRLKAEKYGAIVDLVSMDKKVIRLLKRSSPFIAGSRMFGFSWMYDYYLPTNWVSEYDDVPISMKIEKLLTDCFGYKFTKRDKTLPYHNKYKSPVEGKEFDIFFHLGTSKIRKLNEEIEENLINQLEKYKVLITDGGKTERFEKYKTKYSGVKNFTFRLYENIEDIMPDVSKSQVVLCYDGGQAHLMGELTRCFVMVGSISPKQWSPYDFSIYSLHKKWDNGVEAYISGENKRHIAINFPTWCTPCFNIGCNTRPCINNILPEEVMEIINNCLHADS